MHNRWRCFKTRRNAYLVITCGGGTQDNQPVLDGCCSCCPTWGLSVKRPSRGCSSRRQSAIYPYSGYWVTCITWKSRTRESKPRASLRSTSIFQHLRNFPARLFTLCVTPSFRWQSTFCSINIVIVIVFAAVNAWKFVYTGSPYSLSIWILERFPERITLKT